jgi:hypothetical protein
VTAIPLSGARSRPAVDEARVLRNQLAVLPGQEDLEGAWAQFQRLVQVVRAADTRQVGGLEGEVDALAAVADSLPVRAQRLPTLLSERLGDDLHDAWARLRARDVMVTLRGSGATLRTISDDVHVSTPYLSQLANGTGPVPSDTILVKLQGGARRAGLQVPKREPPPEEVLTPLVDRAKRARAQLQRLANLRPRPTLRIDNLSARDSRRLTPLLEGVLERCLDTEESAAMAQLLEYLHAADAELRDVLLAVANDSDLLAVTSIVSGLDEKGRKGLLAVLESLGTAHALPLMTPEPRIEKQPLDRGEHAH